VNLGGEIETGETTVWTTFKTACQSPPRSILEFRTVDETKMELRVVDAVLKADSEVLSKPRTAFCNRIAGSITELIIESIPITTPVAVNITLEMSVVGETQAGTAAVV